MRPPDFLRTDSSRIILNAVCRKAPPEVRPAARYGSERSALGEQLGEALHRLVRTLLHA